MNLDSEDEVKSALGVDSWRNLSREKFMTFVAAIPSIDKDVALKIVAQFPNFKSLMQDSLASLERSYENAQRSNWKSQKQVHRGLREYRAVLERELERDELTPAARLAILDRFRETVELESEKDSENKTFLVTLAKVGGTVLVVAGAAALAALGGKGGLRHKGGSS